METVEVKIRQLPRVLQDEVEDFVDFLLEKKARKVAKKPTLNWIGGLREFKDKYSALDLQKKAAALRD